MLYMIPCLECKFEMTIVRSYKKKTNAEIFSCSQYKQIPETIIKNESLCPNFESRHRRPIKQKSKSSSIIPLSKGKEKKPKIRIMNCRIDKLIPKVIGLLNKYNPDVVEFFQAEAEEVFNEENYMDLLPIIQRYCHVIG